MKTHEPDELSDTAEGKPQARAFKTMTTRRFESQDLSAALLVKSILFMVAFVPLCLLVLWWLMSTVWQESEPPPSPFAEPQVQTPLPHLQDSPAQDYRAFHERMMKHLNSYGWVDQQAGLVHIPIAIAKRRLLEQGLPQADQPPPPSRMSEDRVRLDPKAATRWWREGPATLPVEREEMSLRDALPPATKAENIPVRDAKEPLGATFPFKEEK